MNYKVNISIINMPNLNDDIKNYFSVYQPKIFETNWFENNKMIGTVELHTYTPSFKAELGYTVSPYYWGFGYAVEASKEVIKYGFEELNLKRIE